MRGQNIKLKSYHLSLPSSTTSNPPPLSSTCNLSLLRNHPSPSLATEPAPSMYSRDLRLRPPPPLLVQPDPRTLCTISNRRPLPLTLITTPLLHIFRPPLSPPLKSYFPINRHPTSTIRLLPPASTPHRSPTIFDLQHHLPLTPPLLRTTLKPVTMTAQHQEPQARASTSNGTNIGPVLTSLCPDIIRNNALPHRINQSSASCNNLNHQNRLFNLTSQSCWTN